VDRKEYIKLLKKKYDLSYEDHNKYIIDEMQEALAKTNLDSFGLSDDFRSYIKRIESAYDFADVLNRKAFDKLISKMPEELRLSLGKNIDVAVLPSFHYDATTIMSSEFEGFIIALGSSFQSYLGHCLELFASTISLSIVDEFDINIKVLKSDEDFASLLHGIISTHYLNREFQSQDFNYIQESHLLWIEIIASVNEFIIAHELSHILLGHFHKDIKNARSANNKTEYINLSIETEAETDKVASALIQNRLFNEKVVHPSVYFAGSLLFLLLRHAIESVKRSGNDQFITRANHLINSDVAPSRYAGLASQFMKIFSRLQDHLVHRELMIMGETFSSSMNLDEALKCFSNALIIFPTNSQSLFEIAKLQLRTQNYVESLKALEIVTRECPDNINAIYLKGIVLYKTAEDKDGLFSSLECFTKIISIDLNHLDAWRMKGIILHKAGLNNEALESLDNALNLPIENIRYHEEIVSEKLFIDLHPPRSNIWSQKSAIYKEQGNYHKAFEAINNALSESPQNDEYIKMRDSLLDHID